MFVESWAPPPQMWIFGAVDFTAALAKVAKVLGYRVVVCDAREIFATRRRFPMADEVRVTWPGPMFDERGAAAVGDATRCASSPTTRSSTCRPCRARSPRKVGYIGVMGSRTTHAKRMQRLAEVGVIDPHDLDRLMSPIGLDIGARTPEETAISICAEIIARRTGRVTPSLRDGERPDPPGPLAADQALGLTSTASPKRSERSNIWRTSTSWPGCGEWTIRSTPRYRLMWPG